MQLESKRYLHDIKLAAERLSGFTEGQVFNDYEQDVMLRSAVERQFEIIGEALSQLARIDESIDRISDYRSIIGFRNILIHGYTDVDDTIVWDIIQSKLPILRREVDDLLAEA